MPKHIGDRVDRRNTNMVQLFDTMSDKDFKIIWEQGQLRNFCNALSLDMHVRATEDIKC